MGLETALFLMLDLSDIIIWILITPFPVAVDKDEYYLEGYSL